MALKKTRFNTSITDKKGNNPIDCLVANKKDTSDHTNIDEIASKIRVLHAAGIPISEGVKKACGTTAVSSTPASTSYNPTVESTIHSALINVVKELTTAKGAK